MVWMDHFLVFFYWKNIFFCLCFRVCSWICNWLWFFYRNTIDKGGGAFHGRCLHSVIITVYVFEFGVKAPSLPFGEVESVWQTVFFYFEVIELPFIVLRLPLYLLSLLSGHHFLDWKRFHSSLHCRYLGLVGGLSSHECYFSFFSENEIRFLNLSVSLSSLSVKAVVEIVNVCSTLSLVVWLW